MRGVLGCPLESAFCLVSVVGRDACGYGPSGEPFDAEADVVDFRRRNPCRQRHVGAEAPSAVGKGVEATDDVVVCVFGFVGEFFPKLGEDVAGAGGKLADCGRVSACESGCDDGCPPFGFHCWFPFLRFWPCFQ